MRKAMVHNFYDKNKIVKIITTISTAGENFFQSQMRECTSNVSEWKLMIQSSKRYEKIYLKLKFRSILIQFLTSTCSLFHRFVLIYYSFYFEMYIYIFLNIWKCYRGPSDPKGPHALLTPRVIVATPLDCDGNCSREKKRRDLRALKCVCSELLSVSIFLCNSCVIVFCNSWKKMLKL